MHLSEKQGGALGVQNDLAEAPKPLKEKTTKAERRALQEAQRAVKAAAKEAGQALIHFLEFYSYQSWS